MGLPGWENEVKGSGADAVTKDLFRIPIITGVIRHPLAVQYDVLWMLRIVERETEPGAVFDLPVIDAPPLVGQHDVVGLFADVPASGWSTDFSYLKVGNFKLVRSGIRCGARTEPDCNKKMKYVQCSIR